jgi:hypothetical protein
VGGRRKEIKKKAKAKRDIRGLAGCRKGRCKAKSKQKKKTQTHETGCRDDLFLLFSQILTIPIGKPTKQP